MSERELTSDKAGAFVDFVIKRMKDDPGFGAAMRRADNPATEYQSWEFLAAFNIDLEKPWERLPYCTVGAALAKAKVERDGSRGLGQAIAECYDKDKGRDQAKARLRRVLACESNEEACSILRPLLGLISSREVPLRYSELLRDLLYFGSRVKARWAQDFYRKQVD